MIALFKGISITSRIIRWHTRSQYSHAAWIDPHTGRVIEAWKGGVRAVSSLHEQHTPGTTVDLFDVEATPVQVTVMRKFLDKQVGKRYDWVGILHFSTRLKEYDWQLNRWFCSELIFAAYEYAGINLLKRCSPHQIAPGHLAWSPLLRSVGTIVTHAPEEAIANEAAEALTTRQDRRTTQDTDKRPPIDLQGVRAQMQGYSARNDREVTA